jgi:outer membrane protein OmpA-like peptidoglycan-associated protein
MVDYRGGGMGQSAPRSPHTKARNEINSTAMMRFSVLMFLATCSWATARAQTDIHGSNPDLLFSLQGNVFDKQTLKPIQGAKVNVVRGDGSSFSALTDSAGWFSFVGDRDRYIEEGTSYRITVVKGCYGMVPDQTTTVGLTESTTFLKEYYLTRISDCGVRPIPVVQFARNSSSLPAGADTLLAEVAMVLKENPNITMEITASTDATEREKLGRSRGEAVLAYLASQGIDPRRLSIVNRGNQYPRIQSEDIARMSTSEEREAAHAYNRRVDFKVLRTDWHP